MLTVNKMYPPEIGGIEVIVKQIAEINSKLLGSSTVLVLNNNKQKVVQKEEEINVIRLGSIFHRKSIRWLLEYKKEIKKLSKDFTSVLYNFPSLQPEFYKSKYSFKKKLVYYHADSTRYGILGKLYQKLICNRFLSNADIIIASNPNIIETSKVLRIHQDKCRIVPYGIDTKHFEFKQNNKRAEILKDLNIHEGKLFLFVGRLNRYKGIMNLLKALSKLPDEYKLVIISTYEMDLEMKEFINNNSLSSRIMHYNNVTNDMLPFYYSACDVFTMPSTDRAEAFGLVAVEAMACGLPVITTELGTGTSFHNINGVTGKIIEPNNVQALVESIREICENEGRFTKDKIISRANEFSLDKFKVNWENIIKEFVEYK